MVCIKLVCINGLWLLPTNVTTELYCVLVESFKAICRFKTLDGYIGMRNVSSIQLKPSKKQNKNIIYYVIIIRFHLQFLDAVQIKSLYICPSRIFCSLNFIVPGDVCSKRHLLRTLTIFFNLPFIVVPTFLYSRHNYDGVKYVRPQEELLVSVCSNNICRLDPSSY